MVVFVSKPAGYALPVNRYRVPQYYYIHQPKGSPPEILEFDGLERTGALPESVDFALFRAEESEQFEVIVFGDTQVTDHHEIGYLRDAFISELADTKASFGISMGDNVNDVLSLYDRYLAVMRQIGIPFYYVPGNHDMNLDSPNDRYAFETYKRLFGPTYYSFQYGKVCFVVLDSVSWDGAQYYGALGDRQLEWLKNCLAFVPQDHLIVLCMHIPIVSWIDRKAPGGKNMVADRKKLYNILRGRTVLALAGHTHTLERLLPGEEEEGWNGPLPFAQIIVGATCGSWWTGPKDEKGIPLSYQRDGAPKGYMVFHFHGNSYSEQYKIPGRDDHHQMNLSLENRRLGHLEERGHGDLPQGVLTAAEVSGTLVVANIFSGSRDSVVQCQVDSLKTVNMRRNTNIPDPYATRLTSSLEDWLQPRSSNHIWTTPLPKQLQPGLHRLSVHTTDIYGHQHQGSMLFEVWSSGE
jgi:hypothetical protein